MALDPEQSEKMLKAILPIREDYARHAEALREQGLEVDGFLASCDEFIALLEGRHEGGFEVEEFLQRLKEFKEETDQFMHIQRQVKAAEFAGNLHSFLPQAEQMVVALRELGGEMELRSAAEIEGSLKQFQAGLAEGRLDKEAFADMSLAMSVQLAEVERRNRVRTAMCFLYWESWPPERWAKLTPEVRAKLEGDLKEWRAGKETYLGTLPLEDRRRLEAMRYEDFEKNEELESGSD